MKWPLVDMYTHYEFAFLAEFPNSFLVLVNVNINVNLESQSLVKTKMGRYRKLSYYVHVYWEDFLVVELSY